MVRPTAAGAGDQRHRPAQVLQYLGMYIWFHIFNVAAAKLHTEICGAVRKQPLYLLILANRYPMLHSSLANNLLDRHAPGKGEWPIDTKIAELSIQKKVDYKNPVDPGCSPGKRPGDMLSVGGNWDFGDEADACALVGGGFRLSLAVIMYIQRVAISVAAVPISTELHLSNTQMGSIFGAFGLSYAFFELPMGLAGDRLGVRRVLGRIVLAWSLFTALTGAAWSFVSLWLIRFLFGAGEAGCFPNLTRMLSAWLPAGERVRAQALMWAFSRWGGAAAPPLVYLIIRFFGWRLGFVALALFGVMWCFIFLAWFRNDPAEHKSVNPAELALLQGSRKLVSHDTGGAWYQLLLRPQILILSLQYFCFSYVWNFYISWLPKWLIQAHGQTLQAATSYAVWPLLLGGFGSLISGFLPLWVSRRWLAFFGFAATSALLFAITRVEAVGLAMALMALASFCSDLTMPISWNACVEIGKQYTATVAATMNMLGNFAGFVAPTLTGLILDHSGNDWNFVLYLMVGAAAISASCWLFTDLTKSKEFSTEGVFP